MAQYANCDENSQAEGLFEVSARSNASEHAQNTHQRVSTSNQNNAVRNPHYENIYESIDQFATVNAPAPAENIPNAQPTIANANVTTNNNSARINLRNRNNFHNNAIQHQRNMAYDVPRHARNYYASNVSTANRRATLEANPNRIRYANGNRAFRQRSFDDTESYHYSHNNFRYENIYEQIREEPIYRNMGLNRENAANRLYGRLDVIGHGIGRIERHLSSSCGNIDHYNLSGGTYAILGHSHLSTVGHVYASNNPKEPAGKSMNFFSCLGRENSQSMSNICRESSNANTVTDAGAAAQAQPPQSNENTNKHTGAIPKIKGKVQNTVRTAPNSHPIHSTALNRISKSSLQWLLMNKWLPLWVGNGSDCNVLDFNFMFSRNCDGCERDDNVIVYDESNGATYANNYRNFAQDNYYSNTVSRPVRYNNSLMRFNERNPHRMYDRRANYRPNEADNSGYEINEQPYDVRGNQQPENPFRRWELNSENNSFRPASVRRITDGTFPNGNNQQIRIEVDAHSADASGSGTVSTSSTPLVTRAANANSNDRAVASTSRGATHNAEASTSSAKLRPDRKAFENATLSSSTESAETESKILSPDLSARRYSENTEDDQYNSGNSSATDDEGNDETISELNTNDTDNSERINEQSS